MPNPNFYLDFDKLALAIKFRRAQMGAISIRKASKLIGISSSTLSVAARGLPVDRTTVIKIAEWLNRPFDAFFTYLTPFNRPVKNRSFSIPIISDENNPNKLKAKFTLANRDSTEKVLCEIELTFSK